MRRLIISDLHIGSMFSKENDILRLLKNEKYDELILAGDIIDFIRIPKFTKKSLDIFNYLLNLKIPIIYIVGNHDIAFNDFINQECNNIKFLKSYEFEDNSKKIRIEHGDDYDNFIIKWEHIMNIICVIFNLIERFFYLDISNYYEKYRTNQRKKIDIKHIIRKNTDVDIFIMGHSHKPEIIENLVNNKKLIYGNSGDWVQHKSYMILENGSINLINLE
jgi:UDP-2,3-diacylglucosamine pyrophosphatase LpxH